MLIFGIIVLEPIFKKGRSIVEMTLATMGWGILNEGLIQIYHEYIKVPHTNIMLKQYDFSIGEINGIFPIASIIAVSSYLILRHISKNTRFGYSIRSVWENSELAQSQGVNPTKEGLIIWVLAGGYAGLAGGIMTMWFHITPISGSWIMTAVFASALLGGIDNLGGAFIGGLLVGLGEIMLVTWGQYSIGVWVGEYRPLISLLTIVFVLSFAPNGLFGTDIVENSWRRGAFWRRINKKYLLVSIVLLMVLGAVFVNTCNVNRERVREDVFSEFSDYGLEVGDIERGGTRFRLENITVFKNRIVGWNISKVFVEPYDSGNDFTFFFIRNGNYWTTSVRLEHYGLCKFKAI
jgi:branched-chain amino acid transport system permease protein